MDLLFPWGNRREDAFARSGYWYSRLMRKTRIGRDFYIIEIPKRKLCMLLFDLLLLPVTLSMTLCCYRAKGRRSCLVLNALWTIREPNFLQPSCHDRSVNVLNSIRLTFEVPLSTHLQNCYELELCCGDLGKDSTYPVETPAPYVRVYEWS